MQNVIVYKYLFACVLQIVKQYKKSILTSHNRNVHREQYDVNQTTTSACEGLINKTVKNRLLGNLTAYRLRGERTEIE